MPNGAAYCALPSVPVRAAAFEPIWTVSMLKTFAKKPGSGRDSCTWIVSFGRYVVENETCGDGPPLALAYCAARAAA